MEDGRYSEILAWVERVVLQTGSVTLLKAAEILLWLPRTMSIYYKAAVMLILERFAARMDRGDLEKMVKLPDFAEMIFRERLNDAQFPQIKEAAMQILEILEVKPPL